MNRTVLNADVLLLVFSLAHNQTKLALMSTCQVLYREGGKQLLKSVEVRLGTETRLESFLRFMDADGGSRMRFLRRLYIDLKKPSASVAEQLEKMIDRLTSVSGLTDLTIHSLEPLLSAHPPLSRAIAELTSLKEIDFYPVGKLSLKMLESMQSELEAVDIGFDRLKSGAADRDATMSLRQFSSSLRYLAVAEGATVDPQDGDPQYPLLPALTLDEPASPITWHYVRAFPNLKNLTIMTTEHGTDEAEAVGLAEFRAENIAQLRRHGCWESLDTFDGTLIMLWLLALPCPVSELTLHDDCKVTPDMLRDALGPARATKLDISFYQFSLFLDEEFPRAFAEGCGATLKVLNLTLEIIPDEYVMRGYDLDLGDVLDAVTDMLRSFSALESVALDIYFNNPHRGDNPLPGEVFAEEMDIDAMCAALREAVPSANCVQFTLRNHWKRGTVTVELGSEAQQ